MYAFKPIQLLLPITYHRIPFISHFKASYTSEGMLINENDSASLGIIGSIGFVILLAQFLRRNKNVFLERTETIRSLAIFNGGALLIGTIGGIGSLFSLSRPGYAAFPSASIWLFAIFHSFAS